MIVTIFYIFLFVFWLENVYGIHLSAIKGLSLTNLVIYIFILAWMLQLIIRRKFFIHHPSIVFILLFVLTVFLSTMLLLFSGKLPNFGVIQAFTSLKSWANPFILFFIVYNILYSEKICEHFLVGLLFFLVVTVFTMVFGAYGLLEFGSFYLVKFGRTSGFGDPNDYASFMVLLSPLLFTMFFLRSGNKLAKIVGCGFVLLVLLGFVVTGSRGGMLGMLVSICFFLSYLKKQGKIGRPSIVAVFMFFCVFGAVSFFLAPESMKNDLAERVVVEEGMDLNKYSSGRLANWSNSLKLFVMSPLVGNGHKSMSYLAEKYFHSRNVGHNLYLSYLAQYGILGLFFYIGAILKMLRYAKKAYLCSGNEFLKYLYISYFSGVFGYLFTLIFVDGSSSHYFFWLYNAVIGRLSHINLSNKEISL